MKTKLFVLAAVLCQPLFFSPFLSAHNTGDGTKAGSSSSAAKDETELSEKYPLYFTLRPLSIKITRQDTRSEPDIPYVRLNEPSRTTVDALVNIDNIVNLASKIWKIVSDNAPVVNIETKYAVAYPQGVTAASQLTRWSRPKSSDFRFSAENFFGEKIIDVEYKVIYTYGASYNGNGKFLTAVAVVPIRVAVGWGYHFLINASVDDSTITNVGTSTEPIAAMQMALSWKISTVLKEFDGTSVYYVQGDGYFEEIASPFAYDAEGVKSEDIKSAVPLLDPEKTF
ncbi:MAG: hypothetical protein NTY45_08115 [Elusimicrobia bacterium]|nr:hypothetical protein [Elusimicrobiota bacterium]